MSSALRLHRAAVAQRLLASAPQAAAPLDWDALGRAPAWLALPESAFATFQCRVGAVLHGRALRLWIDRARLTAAQAALGAPFLRQLLAEPESASIPIGLVAGAEIESPAQVEPVLRQAGAAVLLACLPDGLLRDALGAALVPVTASPMAAELALTLVARTEALAASSPTPSQMLDSALAGTAA